MIRLRSSPARRMAGGAASTLVLALALSGCENLGLSPDVFLKLSESGVVTMKVCPEISVRQIQVEERQQDERIDWHSIWVAEGEHSIAGGTDLQIPSSIPGMVNKISTNARHDKHTEINIVLVGKRARDSITAAFDLRSSSGTGSTWLGTDGNTTKTPCASR